MSRSVHGRSLNEKLSSLVLLPLGQRHPHIKTAVLTYGVKWPSGSRAGCTPGSPARAVPTSPRPAVCPVRPCVSDADFTSNNSVNVFPLLPFLFFIFIFDRLPLNVATVFVRCREGVLRGCEEATGLPAWPWRVTGIPDRRAVPSRRQARRRDATVVCAATCGRQSWRQGRYLLRSLS